MNHQTDTAPTRRFYKAADLRISTLMEWDVAKGGHADHVYVTAPCGEMLIFSRKEFRELIEKMKEAIR